MVLLDKKFSTFPAIIIAIFAAQKNQLAQKILILPVLKNNHEK